MAALVAAGLLLVVTARPAYASTFTVNSTADPGTGGCDPTECTLREAINAANDNGTGSDTISFNIPTTDPGYNSATGVFTIAPSSELPSIAGTVIIDGYSQGKSTKNTTSDDAKPNTLAVGNNAVLKIELSGANAGAGANGLEIQAAKSTVKGLAINRWSVSGILIFGSGATGNKVQGNYIGTDVTGANDLGNSVTGVSIEGAPNSTVGGPTAAARNIISGNDGNGVSINTADAKGNKVQGNYIGTDASGTKDLGNSYGVILNNGAPSNTVGGKKAGMRNVISGNDVHGVYIRFAGSVGNLVQGNYIGTDATGTSITDASDPTKKLGNFASGVLIEDTPNTTVGGKPATRNIISGNNGPGVHISGAGSVGNQVQGNYIGTDVSGARNLGNSEGVFINDAPNNTVGGTKSAMRNVISGNNGGGVGIGGAGATGNKMQGNFIGTDATGTSITDASNPTKKLGNVGSGVGISSGATNNTVGGTTVAARNLISGNSGTGVNIDGADTKENLVQGNFIGTDIKGTRDLGNTGTGVSIFHAHDNTIGGAVAGARNLISGNDNFGVYIGRTDAKENLVQGNFIGTNASGTSITDASDPTKKLGNSFSGVRLDDAPNNTVGGTTVAARNLISGNDWSGIDIFGDGNLVQGNYIGTDKAGTKDLGNSRYGVLIGFASKNTVGGTTTATRNLISGNDQSGVVVYDPDVATPDTTDNSILSNSIHSNGGLGIDLSLTSPLDGRTTNDDTSTPPDNDTGPNNLQNFPVLSSATTTTVTGRLISTPNKTFTIQVFSNPSGTNQGNKLVGQKTDVTTDANGDANFTITLTSPVSSGTDITATATVITDPATGATGDTSEFSDPVTVA